jgi:hypothetical protein
MVSRLTRELYDAEFVLDLKLSRTEMMFSKELRKDMATYEFHCTYNNKSRHDIPHHGGMCLFF